MHVGVPRSGTHQQCGRDIESLSHDEVFLRAETTGPAELAKNTPASKGMQLRRAGMLPSGITTPAIGTKAESGRLVECTFSATFRSS